MKRQYSDYTIKKAKALALNDGHTEQPIHIEWRNGAWHLLYPARNPVVTLARLRTKRFRRWIAAIRRRFAISTQHKILKELRHG
ncbi:hypothetical protein [Azorhizophilus paspali]|uniref:Uncharacterized protein n=1 Tax=Azorhizophilus paspali TaxID=69963 RepID=A0ABV6SLX1_AZOPA